MQSGNGNIKVNTGDVFYAHNKITNPPKLKYHLCINENTYFLINTKMHEFNYAISEKDCSILHYTSYIDCTRVFNEPITNFKILMIDSLPDHCIKGIIEKIAVVPTFTSENRRRIINALEERLNARKQNSTKVN